MSTASYISLANKYRPQKFEDMVGQESISKTLQNALKLGRLAHAYLFYGPRGCGKTTTARILAKALNCTGNGHAGPTAEPCGECPQCREIAQSADMDVLELDAASNTQVEKVREAIIDTVALAASRDRYKVFILDEVHMLSASSFNALLKTIEEPPQHVVFILATTEKHKVPATIVSRCQTFRFCPITADEITSHLLDLAEAESLDLSEKAARLIAKNAGGAMRDALTLLDRAIAYSDGKIDDKLVGEMLGLTPQELLGQSVSALTNKDGAALHRVFETLRAEGFDANSFLKDLKNALGDLFYFSLGQGAAPFEGAETLLSGVSSGLLAALSRKINKLAEEVKFSDNALISAEVGLFTVMDSCLDIEGFIRRLEALERGSVSSDVQTPPSAAGTGSVKATAQADRPVPAKQSPAAHFEASVPVSKPRAIQPQPAVGARAVPAETRQSVIADDRALWQTLLKHFERSPFVYDLMKNCSVQFAADTWTLVFPAGKEYYNIPAKNKLTDLEAAALKLGGRKITFALAENMPAPKAAGTAVEKPIVQAPAPKAAISEEEPFVAADFSAEADKPAFSGPVPQEVKDVLDIFGGEVLA